MEENVKNLTAALNSLGFPPDAHRFLIDLYEIVQLLDDVYDGDGVARLKLMELVHVVLVRFPLNEFYIRNAGPLGGAITTAIHKWHAANRAEEAGRRDEKSYCWRAAFYDIVLLTYHLCFGYEQAMARARSILSIYGETYENYAKEGRT